MGEKKFSQNQYRKRKPKVLNVNDIKLKNMVFHCIQQQH